jgi:hypothetical protein
MPSRKRGHEARALRFSPYLIWSQRKSDYSCESDSEQDEGAAEYSLIKDYLDLADLALKLWNHKHAPLVEVTKPCMQLNESSGE